MENIQRWRWADVDNRLRGLSDQDDRHTDPEPYFRERVRHGTTKERKREAA
jgi:hypothetical protein